MSLLSLPVELLDNICHNSAQVDLVALSRTNSALTPVAQRLLYREISVSSWSHNLAIVNTLAKKPDLALHVRVFSISIDEDTQIFPSFYRLLLNAISNMSSLISLDLFIDAAASWVLGGTGQLYPLLQRLNCSFPFDSHVAAFLEKTPALTELEIEPSPIPHALDIVSLSNAAVPRLSQLVGSPQVAKLLVPGRPLQSMHLHGSEVTIDDITYFAQATANVCILEMTTAALPVPILAALARSMPYLAYLRITLTTHDFSKPHNADFYKRIANALGALPDLTAFELSGIHWGSCKKGDGGNKRVWQSQPFIDAFAREEDLTVNSDLFLAY